MMAKIRNTSIQKRKRPAETRWFFNITPDSQAEMLRRIHFLLDHIQLVGDSNYYAILQSEGFRELFYGSYHDSGNNWELAWEKFRDEMEQQFGSFVDDSMSTLATIDDIPGTGRSIDKYVYQPIGRSIERLLLALELRYFRPPEKSARQIIKFLEASAFSGRYIPDDKICEHSFNRELERYGDDLRKFEASCMSLFVEISRAGKIAKAFQRLLIQAR